ncbi:MAG: 16S rRNA (cytidine(1402)-2'-O)-methyltransferase [Clostridiales bacterium]|nr:16S rRNA (cytidine(1402)-2'-O)-methyltransferase [Clostridiales bacterium]
MVYFVATPIGNLGEITYRAVETLKSVSAIFCEDTRHSQILLSHYGISKPLYSYHKFNEKKSLDFVLSFCEKGEDVAVISDAGMPSINDPGNVLVNALIEKNYPYTVVSGASAFVNAFVLSGYKPPFTYYGFLPEKKSERDKLLDGAVGVAIFYVSVHDIKENMAYLCERLGNRECCLVKELTKTHERARFCHLADVIDDDKGEFVLVVNGMADANPLCELTVAEHLNYYLQGGMTKSEAVKAVAKDRNVPKNEIYKMTIN